jgi:hypothetical protein
MSELLDRVQRRAGRLLRQLVPYNGHFRPTGVHQRSAELAARPGSALTYHEIVPARISRLEMPPAYYDAISVYPGMYHGKPNLTEDTLAAFVIEIANGRVYADNWDSVAIIGPDNKLVGDVSFQHSRATWSMCPPEENNIFQQRYFLEPVRVSGTVCSLLAGGGAAMGNYYHWLVDSLPRLHLVREAGLFAGIDYFLVYDRNSSFVRDSLTALGIRPEQIIDVTTHRHLQAERLIVTSSVRGNGRHTPEWATGFLGSAYLPLPASVRTFSPLVYVSRRDASMRRELNEAEFLPILKEFGFESYALSELSFIEKVSLFSGAEAIVSPVGAGLANLVFAQAGTPLLELHPHTFVEPEAYDTAYRVGMPYQWLICPAVAECDNFYDARRMDFTVPPAELRQALQQVTARLLVSRTATA